MKKLLIATTILLTAIAVKAQQSDLKFGVGLDVGIPANNLSGSSMAVGADLMVLYKLSKAAAITGDFGYTALFGKNGAATTNIVPIRVGLRYYPFDEFYLGAKIGAGFISSTGNSITSTAYSFGAGYAISHNLEIGASYDGYDKNGAVGLVNLRIGYFF